MRKKFWTNFYLGNFTNPPARFPVYIHRGKPAKIFFFFFIAK